MPFAAVARLTGVSWHRVHVIYAATLRLAVAEARKVVFVIEEREADTLGCFADHLRAYRTRPGQILGQHRHVARLYVTQVATKRTAHLVLPRTAAR